MQLQALPSGGMMGAMSKKLVASALILALSVSTPALAQAVQKSAPMAVAIPDTVPNARDVPYPTRQPEAIA